MSGNSNLEEFDLIGNILSEEDKDEDYSPDSSVKNGENVSPVNKKSVKL
jgi:hypothetical protein